jgi:hypothetical protein
LHKQQQASLQNQHRIKKKHHHITIIYSKGGIGTLPNFPGYQNITNVSIDYIYTGHKK